jgi:Zn-dependent peptidase ImmA (M78 family)
VTGKEGLRIAALAASHARKKLGVALDGPVDVFEAIASAGIMLAFIPVAKGLSGAFVSEPDRQPGIMINASHPLARQRFTAAHELGHWYLQHGTSVDPKVGEFSDGIRKRSEEEKRADAFACWFLMPRKLVVSTLRKLGIGEVTRADEVYALSLRLGVSYTAMAWHLKNLDLLTGGKAFKWTQKMKPRDIKRAMSPYQPANMRNDIWALGKTDAKQRFFVRPGDRLIIHVEEAVSSGLLWHAEYDGVGLRPVLETFPNADLRAGDGEPVFGAPAEHVFVFDVAANDARADAPLRLSESPAWDQEAIESRLDYDFVVEPPRRGMPQYRFEEA